MFRVTANRLLDRNENGIAGYGFEKSSFRLGFGLQRLGDQRGGQEGTRERERERETDVKSVLREALESCRLCVGELGIGEGLS